MKTLPLFFVLVATVTMAPAKMVFEKTLVEIDVKPGEDVVIGEFPFKIEGEEETISLMEVTCTCLDDPRVEPLLPDRSPKLNWKVGESGVIKIKMETKQFLGTVDKAAVLKLKGRKDDIPLTIRVNIPELIKVEPTNLKWDLGGPADQKVAKITINHDQPIKIVSDIGRNTESFPYELITIREGWEYEVRMKPTNTAKGGMAMVSLRTDSEHPRFKRTAVYGVVRRNLQK